MREEQASPQGLIITKGCRLAFPFIIWNAAALPHPSKEGRLAHLGIGGFKLSARFYVQGCLATTSVVASRGWRRSCSPVYPVQLWSWPGCCAAAALATTS